jgi:4-hydroxybenzoate polyprenyltransferase
MKEGIQQRVLRTARWGYLASRGFPYGRYLITLFPFYAFLIADGVVDSVWQLAYVIPFMFAIAAGFFYNTLCDAPTDPVSKNPITRGDFSQRQAKLSVIGLSVICLASSIIIYSSWIALATMAFYLLLWLLYSGLGVRFKESLLAPAVASYVLWVGPPSILLIQFSYFGTNPMLLLLGLFLIYAGHEIKHTVIEHEMDQQYGSRTFSVIVGQRRAACVEYVTLSAGFFFLAAVGYDMLWGSMPLSVVFFSILFLVTLAMTLTKGIRSSFKIKKDTIAVKAPYIGAKAFLIFMGAMTIGLSLLVTLFILWVFLIIPYP